ncbi:trafficking protein particle complex subunit 1-like isoform X2 [Artemia franciscana]|uniref:trafficking protein particle complex subunit 1-like isoform X2 n=1 Tax=Artemia franciscana TaxID=6661 RepID=UPI0032DB4DF9
MNVSDQKSKKIGRRLIRTETKTAGNLCPYVQIHPHGTREEVKHAVNHLLPFSTRKQKLLCFGLEGKLMFGMLHSLQSFVSKMSPVSVKDKFLSYKTNKYCLTMLEPPSGVKFVINTDVSSSGVQELVHTIYKQVYVEYITMNPIIEVGEEIKCELFRQKLDNLIKQSVIHSSKAE